MCRLYFDNIVLDLQNSSYPTQPHSIIAKRAPVASYCSFKIFLRFWLVKTERIIQHNQLLLTKYWINDVKSATRCKLLKRWRQNDVKSAAPCRLMNRWPGKPLILVSGKTKSEMAKLLSKKGKYFKRVIKQLLNSAFEGYEEFCRSRRVLYTEAEGRGG